MSIAVDSFTFYKWTIYLSGVFLIIISIFLLYLYFVKYKDVKYIYIAATLNSLGFIFLYLESKTNTNKVLQYTLLCFLIVFFILYTIISILGNGDLFHSVKKISYNPVENLETHDTNIRFVSPFTGFVKSLPGTYLGYGYKEDGVTENFRSTFLNLSTKDDNGGFDFLTASADSTFVPIRILRMDNNGVTLTDSSFLKFGQKENDPRFTAIKSENGSLEPPFHGMHIVHSHCETLGDDLAFILHSAQTKVHSLQKHLSFDDGMIRHQNHNKHPVHLTAWCFSH